MKIKIISSICIAMLVCIFTKGLAQVSTKDSSNNYSAEIPLAYWLGLGSGNSSLGSYSTIANANLEIINHWLITADITSEANSVSNFSSAPNIRMNTYNILAGKIYKQKFSLVTLSAGLGVVSVYTYNNPRGGSSGTVYRKYQYTVGLPILIQGYLVAFQTLGIGVNGYVNLNTIQSTAGANITLILGSLRTHK